MLTEEDLRRLFGEDQTPALNPRIRCHILRVLQIETPPCSSGLDHKKLLYCILSTQQTPNKSSEADTTATSFSPQPTHLVALSHDWLDAPVLLADIVTVIELSSAAIGRLTSLTNSTESSVIEVTPQSSASGLIRLEVDGHRNLLVLRPDVLVSPTRVAEVCDCVRRCVVSERTKGVGAGTGTAATLGNLKHEFIENVIKLHMSRVSSHLTSSPVPDLAALRPSMTDPAVQALVYRSIQTSLLDLHKAGVADHTLDYEFREVFSHIPPFVEDACVRGCSDDARYRLRSLLSAEETLWSPFLGLKGKIDMIASAVSMGDISKGSGAAALPIELKTGKWNTHNVSKHRAQVILYIAMLLLREYGYSSSDRFSATTAASSSSSSVTVAEATAGLKPAAEGLLLYINEEEWRAEWVRPSWEELKALVIARNSIVPFLSKTIHSAQVPLLYFISFTLHSYLEYVLPG